MSELFALECAAKMSCRCALLQRPISGVDQQAVSELLRAGNGGCPGASTEATSASLADLLARAEDRRDDALLGLWSLARDELGEELGEPEGLWAAEVVRRLLPRPAAEAILGLEPAEMLGFIGTDAVIRETMDQQKIGLSDNHLHSGAADELGSILERVIPRVTEMVEPRKLAASAGAVDGVELNAGALLLGVASACATLGEDFDGVDDGGLAGDDWWSHATEAAKAGGGLDESLFKALREPLEGLAEQTGFVPQLSDLYSALREIAAGEQLVAARLQAARRGLVCIVLLHGLISVPSDSDLGIFVPRFQLMQVVRDLFGEDEGRLSSAVKSMYLDSGVTAVELRKSVVPKFRTHVSVADIKSAIHDAVGEHAREAARACEELDFDELIVRMPVTFTRLAMKQVIEDAEVVDFVPFREPIGETLAVADGIVCATSDDLVKRFVGAVDVVGDEKKVSNWVYSIAYQRIAKAESGLEFAVHAGEYFSNRIEGVRRVAEAALFGLAAVRRIGHCLSLSRERGAQGGSGRDAEVLFENAIWALLVLEGESDLGLGHSAPSSPRDLRRGLKDSIISLAPRIFGVQGLSIADICRWYLGRFELSFMAKWIPGLDENEPDEGYSWPRGMPLSSIPKPTSIFDGLMATTIYDRSFSVKTESGVKRVRYDRDAKVPNSLRSTLSTQLGEAADLVLEPVRDWLKVCGVVIESCPSSNTALAGLQRREHPIWEFHSDGLRCSVNTDDPALFGASLNEEYVYAGMVSETQGGDSTAFVRELAQASREEGMIELQLCDGEPPLDVYRKLMTI